jgi:hypothetical protein
MPIHGQYKRRTAGLQLPQRPRNGGQVRLLHGDEHHVGRDVERMGFVDARHANRAFDFARVQRQAARANGLGMRAARNDRHVLASGSKPHRERAADGPRSVDQSLHVIPARCPPAWTAWPISALPIS